MHALSPWEGPVESIFNFIKKPLSTLLCLIHLFENSLQVSNDEKDEQLMSWMKNGGKLNSTFELYPRSSRKCKVETPHF